MTIEINTLEYKRDGGIDCIRGLGIIIIGFL